MAKRTLRLTALLLVLVLIFSLLPISVLGSDAEAGNAAEPTQTVTEETPAREPVEEPSEEKTPVEEAEPEPEKSGEAVSDKVTSADTTTKTKEKANVSKAGSGSSNSSPSAYATATFSATSAYDPGVTLSASTGVTPGQIRYITQNPKNPWYNSSQWGNFYSMQYCWAASMSMSLSYLGINKLPKDILSVSTSDNSCPKGNWGVTYLECSSLEEAMDNYINGNGVFSPPVVTWKDLGDCYSSTDTHVLLAISKKSANSYEVTDPLEKDPKNNFMRDLTIKNGITYSAIASTGSSVYNFKIIRIYQYYKPHETWLDGGKLKIKGGLLTEGAQVPITGQIAGSKKIASVTAGCYNLSGKAVKGCCATAEVNSVGFGLDYFNRDLKLSQLKPGYYQYRVAVTMADGSKQILLKQNFTVRYAGKSIGNTTFYFDNGQSIKFCAAASSMEKGTLCLARNTESNLMRISAESVGTNGYYRLRVNGSGLYLTVYGSSNKPGTKVIQYPKVQKNGQYWQILPGPKEGYYYLMPKCAPRCCLSVMGDAIAEGSPLAISKATTSAARYWLLRNTRPLLTGVRNVTTGLRVGWKAPKYATGYKIYRKAGSTGKWGLVKSISGGTVTSWIDIEVRNGVKYTYRIKACYGKKVSPLSPVKYRYRVFAPAIVTVKSGVPKTMRVGWSINKKATGYQICYATNKSFASCKTISVKKFSIKSKEITKLDRGKTYYVKVRACKTVGQEHFYSAWTTVKKVKVK